MSLDGYLRFCEQRQAFISIYYSCCCCCWCCYYYYHYHDYYDYDQADGTPARVHAERFRGVAAIKNPDVDGTATASRSSDAICDAADGPPESLTDDGRELSPMNFYALLLGRENTVKK